MNERIFDIVFRIEIDIECFTGTFAYWVEILLFRNFVFMMSFLVPISQIIHKNKRKIWRAKNTIDTHTHKIQLRLCLMFMRILLETCMSKPLVLHMLLVHSRSHSFLRFRFDWLTSWQNIMSLSMSADNFIFLFSLLILSCFVCLAALIQVQHRFNSIKPHGFSKKMKFERSNSAFDEIV